jgi:hypothetical protein
MAKQHEILKKIIESLIDTIQENTNSNEATLKHNFFYHLKLRNPEYMITVEENLFKHLKIRGRADYYLNDRECKSYANDVIIEFKINCMNEKLIKHDLTKLDRIKELNRSVAPLFINVFTKELDFLQYLKLKNTFFNAKAYAVSVCPKLNGFYYREGLETLQYDLNRITFIVNNARFLEQYIIPLQYPTIRLPNKGGMTKYINLYKAGREKWGNNKYVQFKKPLN